MFDALNDLNSPATTVLLVLACGYFLGAMPFGLFFSRLLAKTDVRTLGSGNIGATNVLRTGNKSAAILTLTFDLLKGTMPCILFAQIAPPGIAYDLALLAGLAAVLGHMHPCWLSFNGGKGVATSFGVTIALDPVTGSIIFGLWLVIAGLLRYSSLASLTAFLALPVLAFILDLGLSAVVVYLVISILIFVQHRQNIQSLLNGNERRIGILNAEFLPHIARDGTPPPSS